METIQCANLICFFLTIAAAELVFYVVKTGINKRKVRKWVKDNYEPVPPCFHNEGWVTDIRYYILLAFLVAFSFLIKQDILTVALINIYLIINIIFHLSYRWSKIISFINQLQIDENGVHYDNQMKPLNFDNIYLMSIRNWFDAKIKIINSRLIEGIKICRQNKIESCYYIDNIDMKFSRDEFINTLSQSFCSNLIFLLHLLAVIVINSALLLDMAKFGIITGNNAVQNVQDAIYVILQVFSTVGFGDVTSTSVLSKWFFIIMFAQAILTIILGVAYKDFALNRAVFHFDELAEAINTVVDSQKKFCIESILSKKVPFKSIIEVQKAHVFCSQTVFDKLKEYVE